MITNVRSFILCGAVELRPDGNADYLAVLNSRIVASQRPVIFDAWLAIQVELDGKATPFTLKLQLAGGWEQQYETREIPAGQADTDLRMPVFMPLTEEGEFVVTLTDLSRKPRPYEARWRVRFAEDHRVLNPAEYLKFTEMAAAEVKRRAAKTADVIKLPPR